MGALENVEFEFERDGNEVVLSARSDSANFVLTFQLSGAAAFAASAARASEGDSSTDRIRFSVNKAHLETSGK
jgi:hypothetical protein